MPIRKTKNKKRLYKKTIRNMKRLIGGDPIAFSLGDVQSLITRSDYNSIKDIKISITIPSLGAQSLDTPLVDARNDMHKLISPWTHNIINQLKTLEELNANDVLNFEKIRILLLSNDGTMKM